MSIKLYITSYTVSSPTILHNDKLILSPILQMRSFFHISFNCFISSVTDEQKHRTKTSLIAFPDTLILETMLPVVKLRIATGHATQIYNCLGQLRQL